MATKVYPYDQYPRYKTDAEASSYEDALFDKKTIKQTDGNVIPSSSKYKIALWPGALWIGLGALILLSLVLVIVVPIIALANTVNSTTISTICPTTSITTAVTSSPLPDQCNNYTAITDNTRSPDYIGTTFCDTATFTSTPMWVRFIGSSGTLMASCPIDPSLCAADAPGWYSGIYPSLAGYTTSGFVCFSFSGDYCYFNALILITNCNGFYVYYLKEPPACDLRYCTI